MKESSNLDVLNRHYGNKEAKNCRRLLHSAPVRRNGGNRQLDKVTINNSLLLDDLRDRPEWINHQGEHGIQITMATGRHNLKREMTSITCHESCIPLCYSRDHTNVSGISSRNTVTPFLITQRQKTKNCWASERGRRDINSAVIRERLKSERSRRRSAKSAEGQERARRQSTVSTDDGDKERQPNVQAISRFRVAILCVRILVRWLRIIINISNRMTSRTATEEQWYTLYNSNEARALAFNKAMFARERTFAKVPNWAKEILGQEPEARTETDCRRLHALLRGLKSFDKFTEKIQLSMCRAFRYICVENGRVILRRGHVGFNFYFMYSGSVFVNLEDRNIDGDKFEKTETVLVRGDAFGELALLQDIRRTASITCRETCEMLVVDKDTFAKVCPKIFEEELEEKERFLCHLPLFNSRVWTKEMIKRICTEAQIQEYKTNKVIVVDSDEEWIYVCMEGKCQIIRRVALDLKSSHKKKSSLAKRPSTPMLSDEVLDILGKLKTIQDNKNKQEAESDDSDDEIGKERMLDSMSLEYRRDGRRRRLMKNPDKDAVIEKKEVMAIKGTITLTSLMAQNKKSPDGKDYVYLNIGELHSKDVFDLFCIMYPSRRPANSTLILVSLGSRMMRIKRKNFFNTTSHDALLHAKRLAKKERYPSEEMLLRSYREKTMWDNYKSHVVTEIVGPHLKKNGRFSNISKDQLNIMKERNEQKEILLSTLKRNMVISKATKTEDDENDGSSDEKYNYGDTIPQQVFVLPHQLKIHVSVEPIPSNLAVGRRTSVLTKPGFIRESQGIERSKTDLKTVNCS
ncbi:cyclic nucleotide-binding domain-containing protein 2-like isoform X2 [Mizuhopecten yessoensis]|uniref:Cyclic nucleotide-binding domain-containing protein 2 n=1 Tax=Mizuhopecten yessoensis TaxID=6573 RepID=A0A210PU57_MIZYE|nr:cyclic nucleotide-binding domain-containing protein 2-like isoform X2 [Mizuhopecten yessoensis]OWF39986.1 Cyclic nucleotide-binding domain-containing protein 2 [Mizuhopecten yessoensis]